MTILVSPDRIDVISDKLDREFSHEMLKALMGVRPSPVREIRRESTGDTSVTSVYADGKITYDFICEPGMSQPCQK